MKLGIVGHAAEKFTAETEDKARKSIIGLVKIYAPTVIVSGHSPMGGVDIWAEEIADYLGVPTDIKAPKQHHWDAPYGYKARNLDIANTSDHVVCIVVKDYPPDYKGTVFSYCCHCQPHRNPKHVKSGGCWTAWRCKSREWVIL